MSVEITPLLYLLNFFSYNGVTLCLWNCNRKLAHCPFPSRWHKWMLSSDGGILTELNRRSRNKTCPSAALPTTNAIWAALGANPVLRYVRIPWLNACAVVRICPSSQQQARRCMVWGPDAQVGVRVAEREESVSDFSRATYSSPWWWRQVAPL
jgi:hypothetical protein